MGKTCYPDKETAEWIERMAMESSRSESYVIVETIEVVEDALGGEHDNIDRLLEDLEQRLE